MREGFVYMVRTPWLLATLLFASLMILVMMGPLEVLIPFLIKDKLGGGPGDHALVLAAFGIGGAVGSLTMASFRMPRRYLTLMNLMWGVGCLPFLVIGFATAVWQLVVSAFVLGALFSAPMVIWGTLLQRRVPAAHAGPGRLARLLRLGQPDAGLDGAGRTGLRGDRAADDVRDRRHRAGRLRGRRDLWAKLPQDEIAHPLRDDDDESEPARSRPRSRSAVERVLLEVPDERQRLARRSGPAPWSRRGRRRPRPSPSASPGRR